MRATSAKADRYLLVKGSSGLGNRMAVLLRALVYARLTGRRLVIDWSDGRYSSGEDVFDRLFACPSAGRLDELPLDATAAPAVWRGRLRDPVMSVTKTTEDLSGVSIDVRRLDHDAQVAVICGFTFGYWTLRPHAAALPAEWRGLSSVELQRRILVDHLTLRPEIAAIVDDFARRELVGPTIGVHLRHTDNLRGKFRATMSVSVTAIEAAIDRCLAATPGATVFVATDDPAMLAHFAARYPRVTSHPKWFPADAGPIHGHRDCPDKVAMARDALVDVYLLARCDSFVYSSSTSFARLACLASTSAGQQRIDVGVDRLSIGERLDAFVEERLDRWTRTASSIRRSWRRIEKARRR